MSHEPDWNWSQIHVHCLREAQRHVSTAADADDVAQAAVLRAWLRRDSLADAGALWPWLSRITRNEAMRLYERRRPEPRAELPEGATDAELADSVALRLDVRGALRRLPADDQRVLALRYSHDLTCSAAAVVLRTGASTTKVRLHRARGRLARALGEGYAA